VTNAPYGVAKKSLLVMCQGYRQQYGLNAIYLLPVNLYGPRDNFHLHTSHIIPAIVRKCVEAKERGDREIVAWGTGNVSREFLYVEDCAEGLVGAMERYDSPEPMNLGNGTEVTIRQAIETIARIVGFEGRITWDSSKPDGQPRRCLDTSRAREAIGFTARTSFEDGLRKTVDWFMAHRQDARL
jgi:nucleoside-diphosphate-sugar epimerase